MWTWTFFPYYIVFIYNGFAFVKSADDDYKTVKLSTDQGIRGYRQFGDTQIMTFLGIPYALPPTGNRRFDKPHPLPLWTGVKEALTLSPACLQAPSILELEEISEDCLYLNVFTPNDEGSIPVMVYIHSGGFAIGSAMVVDCTRLANKGVVVVSFNYRLTILGFGTTDDDVMPGNFGMLDQIEALKWVQRNIHAFGGDPNQVTVFGLSAGSTSISLHMLSPLSGGLFHRAIMASGSSFSLWGFERNNAKPSVKDATAKIAAEMGCSDAINSSSFLDCMRNVNGRSMVKQAGDLQVETNTHFIFIPRVETTFNFLPNHPKNIWESGKFQNIDTISGFTSSEAASVIQYKFPYTKGISRLQFKEGLLEVLKWGSLGNNDKIVDQMTDFFLHDITDPKAVLARLLIAANDLYNLPIFLQLRKVVHYQTTPKIHRFYQHDYIPSYNAELNKVPIYLGLSHGNDIPLYFYSTSNIRNFTRNYFSSMNSTPQDIKAADFVQTIWTNFVKYGDPFGSPNSKLNQKMQWPGYTFEAPLIAHIDTNLHLANYTKLHELEMYSESMGYIY